MTHQTFGVCHAFEDVMLPMTGSKKPYVLIDHDDSNVLSVREFLEGIFNGFDRGLCTALNSVKESKRDVICISIAGRYSLSVTTRKLDFRLRSTFPTPANKNPVTVSCQARMWSLSICAARSKRCNSSNCRSPCHATPRTHLVANNS